MIWGKTSTALCAAFGFVALPAAAAPVDDYIVMRAAMAINLACGGLKYFEHERAEGAAADYLSQTSQNRLSLDGRMPEADYTAWLGEQQAKVDAAVAAAGCTQQAYAYLLPAKAKAAEEIYRDLTLAFHFASLPEGNFDRLEIGEEQRRAVQGYEAYLQQLYGQNLETFVARQREVAASELPVADTFGMGLGFGLGQLFLDPEVSMKLSSLKLEGLNALEKVHFEVAAEANGYLVRPVVVADRTLAQLVRPDGSAPPSTIVEGPGYLLFDPNADGDRTDQVELFSITGLAPDGTMRVMFFGDAALAHLGDPTVRLYVRSEPLPSAVSSWEMFTRPDFRAATARFEGVKSSSACLGAPCFDFAADAAAALARFNQGDYAELFVSAQPGDDRDSLDGTYRAGRYSNYWTWLVLKGQQPN